MEFKGGHFAIGAPLQNSRGHGAPVPPRSAAYVHRLGGYLIVIFIGTHIQQVLCKCYG